MTSLFRNVALASLATIAMAASLHAQCFESATGPSIGTGDDVMLPMQAIGFAFPFNGVTYTNLHPSTNGFVYLSNAGVPAPGGAGCCTGVATTLVASAGPMIAAWWSDLNVVAPGSVKFNALPGKCVITWEDCQEYFSSLPFTFQIQLHATGEIDYVYDNRLQVYNGHTLLTGMSQGGGALVPPATDFSVTGVSATTTAFQLFGPALGPVGLTGKGIHFVPLNPGWVWAPTSCYAGHQAYGTGCYDLTNDSVYQLITTAPAASAAMSGTAVTFLKVGSSYLATSGGTYVAPSGTATVLALSDDSDVTTPVFSSPFPHASGSTSSVVVCSNGFVSMALGNTISYVVDVPTMLDSPQNAFWSWHDYNPSATGSGQVKFEEVAGIVYITWDGVYSYGTTAPSTMQFQLNLANGNVTIVWVSITAVPNSLAAGEPHLAGYSPAGTSSDPGSLSYATGLPYLVPIRMVPLLLAAAPAPISTPSTGTVVTYTTSNIPEYQPSSGLHVGMNICSITQIPAPGIDLIIIGAPGCPAFVGTLDLTQTMVGIGPAAATQTVTLPIPPGVPSGFMIFSQSVSLVAPFSLPNGQNAFGMTTSNGVASFIAPN
jgi:hypothetical protein